MVDKSDIHIIHDALIYGGTTKAALAALDRLKCASVVDAVKHIQWTLDNSPTTFALCKDMLVNLRRVIVNCELKEQQERERAN